MTGIPRPFNRFLVSLYALTHFVGDSYSAFLFPLLPEFQRRFGLSKFMCGSLAAVQSVSISLIQPLIGFLSDRLQTRKFLILGPALAGIFFGLLSLAPSYRWLMILVSAGGLGVAALHPVSAALTARAGGKRRHLALSLWVAGGFLGAATGFRFVVALVQKISLERIATAMLPGLLVSAALCKWAPRSPTSQGRSLPLPLRQISLPVTFRLLCVVGVCRGLVGAALQSFTPLLLAERGYPLSAGGNALAILMLVGAGGNLLGGWLAEKVGPKKVIFLSLLLTFPSLVAYTLVPAPAYLPLLMAAGLFLFAPVPVEIALAQRSLPQHAAAVSGIFTGTIWGIGGLSMMAAGALADQIGIQRMMLAVWPLSLVASLAAAALPPTAPQD